MPVYRQGTKVIEFSSDGWMDSPKGCLSSGFALISITAETRGNCQNFLLSLPQERGWITNFRQKWDEK